MKKNILSEDIKYANGERITTQKVETITTLADDRATLANYYGTLASLQSQLEQIQNLVVEPYNKHDFNQEISRIKSEMQTIEQAIEIQNQYIKGFEENAL